MGSMASDVCGDWADIRSSKKDCIMGDALSPHVESDREYKGRVRTLHRLDYGCPFGSYDRDVPMDCEELRARLNADGGRSTVKMETGKHR